MTAEEETLALELAIQDGGHRLGDRWLYEEWLRNAGLRHDEDALDDFEDMHAAAVEELRTENE